MLLLTGKQQSILDAIERHIVLTGHAPTVREIGAAVQLRSSCSVQKHLDSLERLGKIQRTSFKYRSIELTGQGRAEQTSPNIGFMVPLLGRVAGGLPLARGKDAHDPRREPLLISVPHGHVPSGERAAQADACAARSYGAAPYFALEVKGDSMQGAGIADGDIVVARRQRAAENGQIVIAQVGGGEPMVKRLFHEGRALRLQPENAKYSAIVSGEARVIGRVTLAIKQY